MSGKKIVPAILVETVVVIGGALLAALIIGNVPPVRDWIKKQWGGTPSPANPWD